MTSHELIKEESSEAMGIYDCPPMSMSMANPGAHEQHVTGSTPDFAKYVVQYDSRLTADVVTEMHT